MNNNRAWNANGINKGASNIENYYNTDKTPVKSVRQQKSQHKFSPLADIRNVEVIYLIKSILNWYDKTEWKKYWIHFHTETYVVVRWMGSDFGNSSDYC